MNQISGLNGYIPIVKSRCRIQYKYMVKLILISAGE